MVFFMWLIFFIQFKQHYDLGRFGILPRKLIGLPGILLAPLLHGSALHIMSNTLPLLILGTVLYFFYGKLGSRVFMLCYLITGVLVWLLARPMIHIGSSGLIYGIASFLFFSGLFRKELISLVIAIAVLLIYGGLFWGVFPTIEGVSWESHLFGAITGAVLSFHYRKVQIV